MGSIGARAGANQSLRRKPRECRSGKRQRALWYRLPAGECGIGFQPVPTPVEPGRVLNFGFGEKAAIAALPASGAAFPAFERRYGNGSSAKRRTTKDAKDTKEPARVPACYVSAAVMSSTPSNSRTLRRMRKRCAFVWPLYLASLTTTSCGTLPA